VGDWEPKRTGSQNRISTSFPTGDLGKSLAGIGTRGHPCDDGDISGSRCDARRWLKTSLRTASSFEAMSLICAVSRGASAMAPSSKSGSSSDKMSLTQHGDNNISAKNTGGTL
jgi:hypothetical protein